MNKILILEDDETDARLMERELCQTNIEFCSKLVKTKDEFIKALLDFSPDLILSDYTLPTITGLEALRLVQDSPANIPLIIVTGSLNEETAAHCIKAGAADYIIKEHLMRLPSAVESALERKKIIEERTFAFDILKQQNQFLNDILESLTHPFLVVNTTDYRITRANSSARKHMSIENEIYCYDVTLCRKKPCGQSNACCLDEIKKTKQSSVVERVFEFKGCTPRTFEVHCFPIVDACANITQAIIYFIDITDRKEAEQQIRKSLQEKEILLKEVYHRVKNNLQVISSLINLQGRSVKTDVCVQGMFQKSRDRIQAMALMHEKLYQSQDLTQIDFVKYIHDLMAYLFCSYGISPDEITLKITVNNVLLDINTAIPCGLIINELVSNSLQHAFPKDRKGEINIALFAHENRAFNLIISDNGVGIPAELDFQKANSLGLQLVKTLVHQLDGEITIDRNNGTIFRIVFTSADEPYSNNLNGMHIK